MKSRTPPPREPITRIAQAQAEALAQWRASKRARRQAQHRGRLEQTSEPKPAGWLLAVERDDWRDAREAILKEKAA